MGKLRFPLLGLVGLSAWSGLNAVTTEDLYVAPHETVTRGAEAADVYNTSLTNSGTLVFNLGNNATYNFTGAESPAWGTYYTTHLAPDVGDEGVLWVKSGSAGGAVGNNVHGHMTVGANGGGDKAKIILNRGTLNVRTLTLAANAQTAADQFELVDIFPSSSLTVVPLLNSNTKPLVVNFTNDSATVARSDGYIYQFYEQALLAPRNGDIILRGHPNAPVRMTTWSGTKMNLFSGSNSSNVVIEGECDLDIDCGNNFVALNSSHIVYRNSGNLNLTCYKNKAAPFMLSYADTLPYGAGRGFVRGYTVSGSSANFYIDLQGKSQKVNGLVLENGAFVTSSSGAATLTFGTDDVAGKIAGDVTDANVSCVKVGAGDLRLEGAQVRSLTVNGGRLLASGTGNSVGTLVLNGVGTTEYGYATGGELAAETIQGDLPGAGAYTGEGWSNCVTEIAVPAKSFVKEGKGLLTCVTPANAHGMDLRVKGGTLRMGGEVSQNKYWRLIAKESEGGYTYTLPAGRTGFPDGGVVTVSLAIGNIGLFSGDGRNVIGIVAASSPAGTSARDLPVHNVVSSPANFPNTNGKYPAGTTNPIASGANYDNVRYAFEDTAGACSNTYDRVDVGGWWGGALYTNQTLVASEPSTWVTLSWRLSPTNGPACSYNLMKATNFTAGERVQIKSWELQSSPTGADDTWVTMDERTNQDPPKDARRFDYNGHVPYLFTARRSTWRFDTFGTVEVDKDATLDLSEIPAENIAIRGLKVDMAAGAGRIKRFAAAANGSLELTNADDALRPDGKIRSRVTLPLTLDEVSSSANLDSWTVTVNGQPSPDSKLVLTDGNLQVLTKYGLFVIVK